MSQDKGAVATASRGTGHCSERREAGRGSQQRWPGTGSPHSNLLPAEALKLAEGGIGNTLFWGILFPVQKINMLLVRRRGAVVLGAF